MDKNGTTVRAWSPVSNLTSVSQPTHRIVVPPESGYDRRALPKDALMSHRLRLVVGVIDTLIMLEAGDTGLSAFALG